MEADPGLIARIDQLIDFFNQRREDIPDGLFDRRTQFVLNGIAFEDTVGRPSSDPLTLMLTRGPAGYRLNMKALVHAVPDARLERGLIAQSSRGDVTIANGQCWLSGHLRETHEALEVLVEAEFTLASTTVVARAAVTVPEPELARIREARLRP
jgi:hypothetical protein